MSSPPRILAFLLLSGMFALSARATCGLPAHGGVGGERQVVRPRLETDTNSTLLFGSGSRVRRPRVALVLSGGGARGMSQIGVLKVLERSGIPVDFIASTSIGSIIGGLYAAGWTSAELESLATSTAWDEILSLADEEDRSSLFVDQKQVRDRSFLHVRFQGLEPVLPPALSSGQRLTDLLTTLVLRSPYHASPSFDDLRIPFRAVATDLVSGRRVILSSGSLAEAMRASATVPLLFTPIERDSMQLVDGGLLSNIPVDVARAAGCDLLIAVNSTSSLRGAGEMEAPWETADQIMGIMMQRPNEEQLRNADVVIRPGLQGHLSSDFSDIDSLILFGEQAAEAQVEALKRLYDQQRRLIAGLEESGADSVLPGPEVRFEGEWIPDSLRLHILAEAQERQVTLRDVRDHVDLLFGTGWFADAAAVIEPSAGGTRLTYQVKPNPILRAVECPGCTRVADEEPMRDFDPLLGRPINQALLRGATERLLRRYRALGYALARINSVTFEPASGTLRIGILEGTIGRIDVVGGERTRDWLVRREFPLDAGDAFEIEKARQGIANIAGTGLFEYVYLDVEYGSANPTVTISVKERPSQLIRIGARVDNERSIQGLLDVRDENLLGTGMELGITVAGGERNLDVVGEYKAQRLFNTYLTVGISGFYRFRDSYLYADGQQPEPNRWTRDRVGEYRTIRAGGMISVGGQLERIGDFTVDFVAEEARIDNIQNAVELEERNTLRIIRVGTEVDTKDRYPFPTTGMGLSVSYEFALQAFGGDVAYNALRLRYENVTGIGDAFVITPVLTVGFADPTMPLSQQFSLGGLESFLGLHEDDRRGRQLLLLNVELRYRLPFAILFDTYAVARYDLGNLTAAAEEITLASFRHGVGIGLAFDTPVGPASFVVGKSFYFAQTLEDRLLQLGPTLFAFSIGYRL